jgi:hypothetical protein
MVAFKKNTLAEKILTLLNEPKVEKKDRPALKYGNDNESNARQKYCEVRPNSEVVQCGLVIKDKFDWFAGSPDGIVRLKTGSSDGFYGLLEIKVRPCHYQTILTLKLNEWLA